MLLLKGSIISNKVAKTSTERLTNLPMPEIETESEDEHMHFRKQTEEDEE